MRFQTGSVKMTERAKMKEFTNFAVPRSFLPELQICFFEHGKMYRGHILNVFQTSSDTENTLKIP